MDGSPERNEGKREEQEMGSAARWDDGMGRVRRAMPPQNAISSPLAASRPRPLPSVDLRFHSGAETLGDEVIIKVTKSKL